MKDDMIRKLMTGMITNISEHELLNYDGLGNMPDDFDEYWHRAISEMESVKPNVEMKQLDVNLQNQECFDGYFTGVRKAKIHFTYIRPRNAKNAPIVFKTHGYGNKVENLFDSLAFASQGYCVMNMDCRGQGGRSEDTSIVDGSTFNGHILRGIDNENPDDLLFRQIFLDTAEMVRIAENFEEIDNEKMYTYGGSQGGGLAIACAALSPQIKKTVAYYPFLSDYKYAYLHIESAQAFSELRSYFKILDPRHESAEFVFNRLGYIDIQNLAKMVKADVLMASGMRDNFVPVMTHFAMYNKLKTNKRYFIYPEYGHEKLDDIDDIAIQWLNE